MSNQLMFIALAAWGFFLSPQEIEAWDANKKVEVEQLLRDIYKVPKHIALTENNFTKMVSQNPEDGPMI